MSSFKIDERYINNGNNLKEKDDISANTWAEIVKGSKHKSNTNDLWGAKKELSFFKKFEIHIKKSFDMNSESWGLFWLIIFIVPPIGIPVLFFTVWTFFTDRQE